MFSLDDLGINTGDPRFVRGTKTHKYNETKKMMTGLLRRKPVAFAVRAPASSLSLSLTLTSCHLQMSDKLKERPD